MGWNKKSNVAQYKGASWDNFVHKETNCSVEDAMRIGVKNPDITFFFICRENMVLEGPVAEKYGPFEAGDAVFFSGEPWYGDAPQADAYEKTPLSVVYIDPKDNQQFENIINYVTPDGTPAIDVVSIFAGNYAADTVPYLRAENNNPPTDKPFNTNIQNVLTANLVKTLQDKGIIVLLTILNGQSTVGWSEFTSEKDAQSFVNYLQTDVVDKYGLDGIDIDDEYSKGSPVSTSLAMVSTLMKRTMPDKLLTKALWSGLSYFKANWEGHTLGANLDYGWEMTYFSGTPKSRLSPYLSHGMEKNQLVLGFSAEDKFKSYWSQVGPQAKETVAEGFGGCMLFDFENQPASLDLMKVIVDAMHGPGTWTVATGVQQKETETV